MEVITLPKHLQDQIQESIFSFEFNGSNAAVVEKLSEVIQILIKAGAEAIIMGCIEIPIIFHEKNFNIPLFDSNGNIANIAV